MPAFSRRAFLDAAGAAALALPRGWGAPVSSRQNAPNIVVILADDLGYGDLSVYNPGGKLATPHVDTLARQGVRFTDAHSGSAVCSPTRYGLLTGRYAWRTRLQFGVLRPFDPPLIEAERLTLPALLKSRGYATACIGKWHLGWDWPKTGGQPDFTRPITGGPTARGFDFYFGTDVPNYPPYCFLENDRTAGQPTAEKTERNLDGVPGPMLPGWRFDRILPALAERSREFIQRRAAARQPFFLYVPLTSPHEPIAPSEAFRGKSGISPQADFILETDWAVGQIVAALDESGAAANTLTIFTSDNGHSRYIDLDVLLKSGHRPSGTLRGYKASIYEGGHRIPFIARWPGRIRPGTTCDHLIGLGDLMATCAAIAGVRLPAGAAEDSISFLPLLEDPRRRRPVRDSLVHHSGNGQFALRDGPWKLIVPLPPETGRKGEGGAPQLFHLGRDLSETEDLAAREPERVARMTRRLEEIRNRSTPERR